MIVSLGAGIHGAPFHRELARLRTEFDRLQSEHALRHGRTPADERDHLDRFNRWIADVETFRRTYLVHDSVVSRQ